MAEEKKPVKGQEFLQRFGRKLMGAPNPPNDPTSTAEHYENQTKALQAQDNYEQTKDRIANPPSAKEMQAKREQDLEKRAEEADKRAREADEKIRNSTEEARKEAETAAAQARQEADEAKAALQNNQIEMLSGKLDDVLKSKKPLQEQMDEYFVFADQMAAKMGWVKPGTVTPASGDPQISLEIARLNIEDTRAQREHERQMEKDRRDWDLKIIELKDTREFKKAELDQKSRRDDMLFTAPQTIGAAFAQGLIDHAKGGAAPSGISRGQPPGPQTFKIQAGVGDSGEVDCPVCNSRGVPAKIGIGPHSDLAQCVGCNTTFDVERIPAPVSAAETQSPEEEE